MKRQILKSVLSAAFLLFCALFVLQTAGTPASAEEGEEIVPYIVVSLGDSYASGEGVEPFYDQELPIAQKVNSEDWIAHRSEESWAGKLRVPYLNAPLSAYKDLDQYQYWYFKAISGAKTAEITGIGVYWDNTALRKKCYQIDAEGNLIASGIKELPPQIDVFKQLEYGSVRYVTLSIGGNDAQFVPVVKKAFLGSMYLNFNSVGSAIDDFYKNNDEKIKIIMRSLTNTYREISKAAGPQATILVTGYPRLLDEDSFHLVISEMEARKVNTAVMTLNAYIEKTVRECRENDDIDIWYIDVAERFNGHAAYSDDPYIFDIELNLGPFGLTQDINHKDFPSSYSFHPNLKGIEVYRDCVQKKINELEENRPKPDIFDPYDPDSGEPGDSDVIAEGSCGDELTWTWYADGTVIISGTGEMWDYDVYDDEDEETSPWARDDSIKKVIVNDGVTGIGKNAFIWCQELGTVSIPTSVVNIGEGAFFGCYALKEVKIPRGVANLDGSAFRRCVSLEAITVENGNPAYRSVDGVLFDRDGTLLILYPAGKTDESYRIPDGVRTIGFRAFDHSRVREIVIPEGVTGMEMYAFEACEDLAAASIPTSITEIPYGAFIFCDSMKEVYYDGSPEEWLDLEIDSRNDGLDDAWIHYGAGNTLAPAPVDSPYAEFLAQGRIRTELYPYGEDFEICCYAFADLDWDGTDELIVGSRQDTFFSAELTGILICRVEGDEVIPVYYMDTDVVWPYPELSCETWVMTRHHGTGGYCETEYVTVSAYGIQTAREVDPGPDGGEIEAYLNGEPVPPEVLGVELWSRGGNRDTDDRPLEFTPLDSAGELTFDERYGDPWGAAGTVDSGLCGYNVIWTFKDNGLLLIEGTGAMWDYTILMDQPWQDYQDEILAVKVCDGVLSVGDYSFRYCSNLEAVSLADTVTSIGEDAFYMCDSLRMITLPDRLNRIGPWAFCFCDSLTDLTIPDGVTEIGESAFFCASSLWEINIPASVTSIGKGAFDDCTSLHNIAVDPDNPVYTSRNGCLLSKDEALFIRYPEGKQRWSFTIFDGITTVGEMAFYGCKALNSVTIPDGVTRIEEFAFYYCWYMQSITIPASVVSIGDNAFDRCGNLWEAFYCGPEEDWKGIAVGEENENLLEAYIYFNYHTD